MRYNTLLFDVDDTILDFKAAELQGLSKLFANHGYELSDELLNSYQTLNQQLWKDYEENKRTREEVLNMRFGLFFEQLGKKVDSAAVEKEYRQYLNQGSQRLGNSLAIVSDLAKKADLYVVTNGVAKTQYQRLEAAQLLPYFKEIFVSETIGYQKPRIEFFQHVFQHQKIVKFLSYNNFHLNQDTKTKYNLHKQHSPLYLKTYQWMQLNFHLF